MKKLCLMALLAGAGLLGQTADAAAAGYPGCSNCQGAGPRLPFFRQTASPAFQAAPWYSYWPYNSHFMTPAPLTGAYYAPPGGGAGGMQNPYFANPYYGGPAGAAPQQMPGTAMPAVVPAK